MTDLDKRTHSGHDGGMSLSLGAITVDAAHAQQAATFWARALSYEFAAEPEAGEFVAVIGPKGEPAMTFIQVPEGKAVKNRMHLDLSADDREVEVARLVELGATVHSTHDEWGITWTTLLDPEGNEFCVSDSH